MCNIGDEDHSKYNEAVLNFYLKILGFTGEPISTIIESDKNQILLDSKLMISNLLELFNNASVQMKREIRK